jgi:hypothetical protein
MALMGEVMDDPWSKSQPHVRRGNNIYSEGLGEMTTVSRLNVPKNVMKETLEEMHRMIDDGEIAAFAAVAITNEGNIMQAEVIDDEGVKLVGALELVKAKIIERMNE